jgi:hypothetical protein
MQGYNKKKGQVIQKKRNPIGKYNIERKNAITNVRLRSLALPEKQANILFVPFAHSIIFVRTMGLLLVESRVIIVDYITSLTYARV